MSGCRCCCSGRFVLPGCRSFPARVADEIVRGSLETGDWLQATTALADADRRSLSALRDTKRSPTRSFAISAIAGRSIALSRRLVAISYRYSLGQEISSRRLRDAERSLVACQPTELALGGGARAGTDEVRLSVDAHSIALRSLIRSPGGTRSTRPRDGRRRSRGDRRGNPGCGQAPGESGAFRRAVFGRPGRRGAQTGRGTTGDP